MGYGAVAHAVRISYGPEANESRSINQAKHDSEHFNCDRASQNKSYGHHTLCPRLFMRVWRRLGGEFCWTAFWPSSTTRCRLMVCLQTLRRRMFVRFVLNRWLSKTRGSGFTCKPYQWCAGGESAGHCSSWEPSPFSLHWRGHPSYDSNHRCIREKSTDSHASTQQPSYAMLGLPLTSFTFIARCRVGRGSDPLHSSNEYSADRGYDPYNHVHVNYHDAFFLLQRKAVIEELSGEGCDLWEVFASKRGPPPQSG